MENETQTPSLEATAAELMLAISQLRRRLRAEANPGEFNLSQMSALVRLERHGWLTTAELARIEGMKPQSMGTILSAFESQNLVERRPHPTDRRQVQFALTPSGLAARQRQSASKRAWLRTAMESLGADDRARLDDAIRLLNRLGEA